MEITLNSTKLPVNTKWPKAKLGGKENCLAHQNVSTNENSNKFSQEKAEGVKNHYVPSILSFAIGGWVPSRGI